MNQANKNLLWDWKNPYADDYSPWGFTPDILEDLTADNEEFEYIKANPERDYLWEKDEKWKEFFNLEFNSLERMFNRSVPRFRKLRKSSLRLTCSGTRLRGCRSRMI